MGCCVELVGDGHDALNEQCLLHGFQGAAQEGGDVLVSEDGELGATYPGVADVLPVELTQPPETASTPPRIISASTVLAK